MADIFQTVFSNVMNEDVWISNTIWLNVVPKDPIDNTTALVQITARHQTGDKTVFETAVASMNLITYDISSSRFWTLVKPLENSYDNICTSFHYRDQIGNMNRFVGLYD